MVSLDEQGEPMSMDSFYEKMVEMNLRNSIFIDCTASYDIPAYYQSILRQSISIVTPNKVACSSDFDHYLDLKKQPLNITLDFYLKLMSVQDYRLFQQLVIYLKAAIK